MRIRRTKLLSSVLTSTLAVLVACSSAPTESTSDSSAAASAPGTGANAPPKPSGIPSFGAYQTWGGSLFGTQGTLLGDVDGDGHADLVQLGYPQTTVSLSTGAAFGAPQKWWGAFYGSHGTLLGDVDGDGRADLVAVGDGFIGVIRSTGTGFGAYETWWSGFYGTHGTLLGDVDGDGRADLVAVGDGFIGVVRSTGTAFGAYETWWGSFYGTHGTLLADIDGDHRADLVGLGDGYIGAIRSTGSAFGGYETWWGGSFYGSHGTMLADVDGDGRADLVGLGDGYVGAIRSTGGKFGGYETWWGGSFYGSHGTMLGDVDGDGRADLAGVGDGYTGVLLSQSAPVKRAMAKVVDWGYLRTQQMSAVVARIQAVQNGSNPRSSLDGLAAPSTIDALLALDLTKISTPAVERKTFDSIHTGPPTCIYCGIGGAPTIDVFPSQVDLGEMKSSEWRHGRVTMISPVETDVSVSFGDKSAPPGSVVTRWDTTKLTTYKSVWLPKHNNPTVFSDQTSAHGPIHVLAGEELTVEFRFEPGADDNGLFNTLLFLDSPAWQRLSIPVKATVTLLGSQGAITASYDGFFKTLSGSGVDMPVTLVNIGAPRTATLAASWLPTGVTMTPVNVTFTNGNPQNVTLHFDVAKDAPAATEAQITVALSSSGISEQLNFSASIYDPIYSWTIPHLDASTVHEAMSGSVKADGTWTWHVSIGDNAVLVGDTYETDFTYLFPSPGGVTAAYKTETGRLASSAEQGDSTKSWDEGSSDPILRDNFMALVDWGVRGNLTVNNDIGPWLTTVGVTLVGIVGGALTGHALDGKSSGGTTGTGGSGSGGSSSSGGN